MTSILIADDNPIVRRALRAYLERQPNWRVCGEAVNGKEALEKAPVLLPDLILLDFSMPIMSGVQAAHELKKSMPYVKLVLWSVHAVETLEKGAVASGFDLVCSKSDGVIMLVAKLQKLVDSLKPPLRFESA